jgi:putative DNA primase/helicase
MIQDFIFKKLGSCPKEFKLNRFVRWGHNNRFWAKVENNYCLCGDFVENKKFVFGKKTNLKYEYKPFNNLRLLKYWDLILDNESTTTYLNNKGVKKSKYVKLSNDTVHIPFVSFKHGLSAIQEIYPNSRKHFVFGSRLYGSFFTIGELNKNTMFMVEGYATGLSLSELTDASIIVTGSSNNVREVYNQLRLNNYNNIVGIPDNDDYSMKAFEIMPIIKIPTVVSGYDVNDLNKYEKEQLRWLLN